MFAWSDICNISLNRALFCYPGFRDCKYFIVIYLALRCIVFEHSNVSSEMPFFGYPLNHMSVGRRFIELSQFAAAVEGGGGFRRGRAPLRDSFWKPTITAKRRNFQIFYEEIKKNHYQGWVGVSFFPSIYQKIVYPPRGRGLFCKIYTLGPIN